MFDDKEGYWVTHEDYKQLLDKYKNLELTPPVVVVQSELLIAFADWLQYHGKWQVKDFLKEYKSN